jgi:hypothetical protein
MRDSDSELGCRDLECVKKKGEGRKDMIDCRATLPSLL